MNSLLSTRSDPLPRPITWVAVGIVLLLGVGLSGGPAQAQDVTNVLLGRINTLRGELGLAPYTLHPALTAAAQNHAQWMASTGQVSHLQSDGSRPSDRAQAAGYNSSWVSENIYMGGLASVDSAWSFWLNSSVHYAGLTSTNYQHIGIATAQGTGGQAFVLVFGVPGGASNSGSASRAGSDSANSAPAEPPSYVVGVDSAGNIMHQVQPGDTLGDILLTYGYTWDDLPALLDLNAMTEEDIRTLEVGAIILVPPQEGTYTPTPESTGATETPLSESRTPARSAATATGLIAPVTYIAPSATQVAALPSTTSRSAMVVRTLPVATSPVDSLPVPDAAPGIRQRPPVWLLAALAVQFAVLCYASFEFVRRLRQKDDAS